MQSYILSVVGMILLAVVSGLILPEGKMSAFVKSAIALFLFFVIVSPVVKLFRGEKIFSDLEVNIQENFLQDTNSAQVETIKNRVENSIDGNFGADVDVEILWKEENGVVCVEEIEIWVIDYGEKLHTNGLEEITNHVASLLNVEKEQVNVYG